MEFWQDLSKKITDAADYTVKETEKLTAIAKVKYKLSGTKSKTDLLYQAIGKLKYGETVGNEPDAEMLAGLCAQVTELLAETDKLQLELAQLMNYKLCCNCGAKIERDMPFCPRCGTKQPDETATSDAADEADGTDEDK